MPSMYDATIPNLKRALTNLAAILSKGQAYVDEKKVDPSVLLNARLFIDMYPLTRQIQIATDMSKGAAARLAGIEVPKYEDNETTFAELQARIAKTLAFIESVTPAQFEGSESRDVVIKTPNYTYEFKGEAYLFNWVLPNLYFHVTTAYNIMRHHGVELGKMDFLGAINT